MVSKKEKQKPKPSLTGAPVWLPSARTPSEGRSRRRRPAVPPSRADLARGVSQLALIVAQHRDRASVPSGIKMAALEEGLKKLSSAAKGREGERFPA